MKIIKLLINLCFVLMATNSYASCNFKNNDNIISLPPTSMNVIVGYIDVVFNCTKNSPYKLYSKNAIRILDNNEEINLTFYSDLSMHKRLDLANPIIGFGVGGDEIKRIYIKITGKGPNLYGTGNIVLNSHNLNFNSNLVLE